MRVDMKIYKAMVWDTDGHGPGQRVTVLASDLADAKRRLEAEHGEGRIFDLHNEEEASRIR
jgi:hypothetical protein